MKVRTVPLLSLACVLAVFFPSSPSRAQSSVLMDAMNAELHRAMPSLGKGSTEGQQPPYYISYSAHDVYAVDVAAQQGALLDSEADHPRLVNVVIRVGSPQLDNTHGVSRGSAVTTMTLPLQDDRRAIARSLWWATNQLYGTALQTYLQVKTETQVRAREEDTSPDFSTEGPQVSDGDPAGDPDVDRRTSEDRTRALSAIFQQFPHVYADYVELTVQDQTNYFVSSERSNIVFPRQLARVVIFASTRADDGMNLYRMQTFEARTAAELPSQQEMVAAVRKLGTSLEGLRTSPVTQPFDGPALLSGRAAEVFFHEVLGHRLEGQRQRGDEEGQTFTKDVGKPILPDFLSVADDPTMTTFDGSYLSGAYTYDDEGQRARKVDLIQQGVLKTFLMSRLPIASFAESNGHGRAQIGLIPTGRQGNLIVTSTNAVSNAQLRKAFIDEIKKQGKPYGLYFEGISSGFAVTQRSAPQAVSVVPLVVYRVYAHGRPDELVRGAALADLDQRALRSGIRAAGDQTYVDNIFGDPAATILAPALLIDDVTIKRAEQRNDKLPFYPPPD